MEFYRIAESFFLYDLLFTLLFILVAGTISVLSFRINRLAKRRQLNLFGLSFLAFALSHILMLLANLARAAVMGPPHQLFPFWPLLMGSTFTLHLLGLVLLLYTTFKVQEIRIPLLLGAVIAASMLFVQRPVFLFHIIATILLFFLIWYYLKRTIAHRHASNLLVLLAFLFLLLGNLTLVFSLNEMLFFSMGRLLQLAGYGCFLANLVLVFRK